MKKKNSDSKNKTKLKCISLSQTLSLIHTSQRAAKISVLMINNTTMYSDFMKKYK